VEEIVEAISINSVPWRVVYPDRESPLTRFGGGGVSGKNAQPCAWCFRFPFWNNFFSFLETNRLR